MRTLRGNNEAIIQKRPLRKTVLESFAFIRSTGLDSNPDGIGSLASILREVAHSVLAADCDSCSKAYSL